MSRKISKSWRSEFCVTQKRVCFRQTNFWTSAVSSVVWILMCVKFSVLNLYSMCVTQLYSSWSLLLSGPPAFVIFWTSYGVWFILSKAGAHSRLWSLARRSPFPITAGVPDLPGTDKQEKWNKSGLKCRHLHTLVRDVNKYVTKNE